MIVHYALQAGKQLWNRRRRRRSVRGKLPVAYSADEATARELVGKDVDNDTPEDASDESAAAMAPLAADVVQPTGL